MNNENHFGPDVARTYDAMHGGTDTAQINSTVDVLFELAGNGPALEFAIGTGRIALPLAARGCVVAGIELSPAMVAELRKKETGTPIPVTLGDMTSTRVAGPFSLVFLVFNTIDNLQTQAAQVACFQNAADHLQSGGLFVIETLVPPLQRLPFGETLLGFAATDDHLGTDEFNVATQTYRSHHVWSDGDTHQKLTVPFRYAWPAEMDLMAKMAGMELKHRWAGWDKAPFDRNSTSHVSVWQKI